MNCTKVHQRQFNSCRVGTGVLDGPLARIHGETPIHDNEVVNSLKSLPSKMFTNSIISTFNERMTNMFNGCGVAGMTTLDLGPAFTKLASTNTGFVTNCGKSETVIKATESILLAEVSTPVMIVSRRT